MMPRSKCRCFTLSPSRCRTIATSPHCTGDATLWGADVEVISRGPDDPQALVKVALTDPGGKKLSQTDVTGTLFCDDFFAAPDIVVKTDAAGTAVLAFKDQLVGCRGKRYVHIAAGKDYPLVEKVRAIPSR